MSAVWLSYAPRVLLQHDFLTQKECAYLIKLAKEQCAQSCEVALQEWRARSRDEL